jgi:hypothetical protein
MGCGTNWSTVCWYVDNRHRNAIAWAPFGLVAGGAAEPLAAGAGSRAEEAAALTVCKRFRYLGGIIFFISRRLR